VTPGISPPVQATMGKAKVAGLIVDKKEIRQTNEYAHMSDEELHDLIRSDPEVLGIDLAPRLIYPRFLTTLREG
jgi:hypothetical protein